MESEIKQPGIKKNSKFQVQKFQVGIQNRLLT